jgi:hypothetical protein
MADTQVYPGNPQLPGVVLFDIEGFFYHKSYVCGKIVSPDAMPPVTHGTNPPRVEVSTPQQGENS